MKFPYLVEDYSELRIGDRIEITWNSGDVLITNILRISKLGYTDTYFTSYGATFFWERTPDGYSFPNRAGGSSTIRTIDSIRILTRNYPKYKQGNIISAKDLASLPAGSIIRSYYGALRFGKTWLVYENKPKGVQKILRTDTTYITHETQTLDPNLEYKIEYLNGNS